MTDARLTELAKGDNATIKNISAGGTATRRLYEMGLNTGAQVKVVKNDFGPIIVSLLGNKIALGRGLAKKIVVNH